MLGERSLLFIASLLLGLVVTACSGSESDSDGGSGEVAGQEQTIEQPVSPPPREDDSANEATADRSDPDADSDVFLFGFSDDAPKFEPSENLAPALELGANAFRITLIWEPGKTEPDEQDIAALDQAVSGTQGLRLVVAVYAAAGDEAPTDEIGRQHYCAYVGKTLERYRAIRDVVIWNESNKSRFWKPQFDGEDESIAPAAYVALLAHCWDVLHAFRSDVNVIAPATSPRGNDRPDAKSNVSHSPGAFIREMGAAYRQRGRANPLFDTVGHHAYGTHSAEPPSRRHSGSTQISIGDWDSLMAALGAAFEGTGQPIPGECRGEVCPTIWYLEIGYQTRPDPEKAQLYSGAETDSNPLLDRNEGPAQGRGEGDELAPDQATQTIDSVRLAFCQPYVDGYFNFLLWDEPRLPRWQSAPLWVDRTPKDSYGAFKQVITEVTSGSVDCSKVPGTAR